MSKKRETFKSRAASVISEEGDQSGSNLSSTASQLFGGSGLSESEKGALKASRKERIEPTPIDQIKPDPAQPRRAVPSEILSEWQRDTSAEGMARLFERWTQHAAYVTGIAFDDVLHSIESIINDNDQELLDDEIDSTPAYDSLIALARLAGDIRVHGLTNPVTLSRSNKHWVIETGERRWLAYHLLNVLTGEDATWSKIPARHVDERSIWRQASENSARDDLNAIGKARQLALLLMDLHGVDKFQSFEAFENEQDFYSQVADGNIWRVPRGKGEQLLNAMGLKSGKQIRDYRALLRLPHKVWLQADDENWPEMRIRELQNADTAPIGTVSRNKNKLSRSARRHIRLVRTHLESRLEGHNKVDDSTIGELLIELGQQLIDNAGRD